MVKPPTTVPGTTEITRYTSSTPVRNEDWERKLSERADEMKDVNLYGIGRLGE